MCKYIYTSINKQIQFVLKSLCYKIKKHTMAIAMDKCNYFGLLENEEGEDNTKFIKSQVIKVKLSTKNIGKRIDKEAVERNLVDYVPLATCNVVPRTYKYMYGCT